MNLKYFYVNGALLTDYFVVRHLREFQLIIEWLHTGDSSYKLSNNLVHRTCNLFLEAGAVHFIKIHATSFPRVRGR